MGQIYRAHDQKDDRPVALKVLDARGRPQESAARFAHEAELLCSLQHPGLVRYLAHDIAPSGNPFFAMGGWTAKTWRSGWRGLRCRWPMRCA